MARPQQRYKGVRQRHWGSWVSEIRHPTLKTRVWLGTYETAEDAAKAYDEAERLMCGRIARTNFPRNPNEPDQSSFPSRYLSATLVAKLQRFQMASLQTKESIKKECKEERWKPFVKAGSHGISKKNNDMCVSCPEERLDGAEWTVEKWGEGNDGQHIELLRDDHIEQMIEELLDYSLIELRS